ncbi:MAG: response regulator transcription factor [Tepidisphaeraceae bacterium]
MSHSAPERQLPIGDRDIADIVRLIGGIAGMTEPLAERRRALMRGLVRLIDADIWAWVHSGGWAAGKPYIVAMLDGGWADDAERNRLWHANSQDEWAESYRAGVILDRPSTRLFDATHPGWGDGTFYTQHIRPAGFEHLLFSMYPLPDGLFSGWALHRRSGKPPYTPREVAIVNLVLGQIDWLHAQEAPSIAGDEGLCNLSPRLREILVHLLGGDSRKQIAMKLNLSEFTVGDYIKSLYKRLSVTSRGELMARFLPGQ